MPLASCLVVCLTAISMRLLLSVRLPLLFINRMCLHPKSIRGTFVKCGKCPECRQAYRDQMGYRLFLVSGKAKSSLFVTLTFDDEHLPTFELTHDYEPDYVEQGTSFRVPCFDKKLVQGFLKRIRRHIEFVTDGKITFKYFITSELGEQYHRPHHHGVFFFFGDVPQNWIQEFNEILYKYWTYGLYTVSLCNGNRTAYATAYSLKDSPEYFKDYRKKDDPRKPFRLFSRGLVNLIIDDVNEYLWNGGDVRQSLVTHKGRKFFDPYLKSKIDPSIREEIKYKYNNDLEIQKNYAKIALENSKESYDPIKKCNTRHPDYSIDLKIIKKRKQIRQLKKGC